MNNLYKTFEEVLKSANRVSVDLVPGNDFIHSLRS